MSHRKIVTFPGKLEGMGRTGDCIVGAVRVSLPGTSESALTRFSIHNEPTDLPDGQYVLSYRDGSQMAQQKVQRQHGAWVSRS
jgi:hypothetical protein